MSNQPGFILSRRFCTQALPIKYIADAAFTRDGQELYVASGLSANTSSVGALTRSRRGALRQIQGAPGCVANPGAAEFLSRCATGRVGTGAKSVAVSPDGRHVYAATGGGETASVAVFARGAGGGLTQLDGADGCVALAGNRDGCEVGRAVRITTSVAVSPDGRNVYAASGVGVATFVRDPASGALEQPAGPAGCVAESPQPDPPPDPNDPEPPTPSPTAGCTDGRAVSFAQAVAVSRDGRHVYLGGDAIAIFARDPNSGALTQLGTANGRGRRGAIRLVLSPDGRNVYATTEFGEDVAIFARNSGSGALRQLAGRRGCLSCALSPALDPPAALAITPDGRNAYGGTGNVLVAFSRRRDGSLRALRGRAACISRTGTGAPDLPGERRVCAVSRTLRVADGVTVAPNGRTVYAYGVRSTGGIFAQITAFSRRR